MKDYFHKKANNWDNGAIRVEGAKKITDAIKSKILLNKDMEILDFGVGTGLLGFNIAKNVKQVYGVDTSLEMLKKLKVKNSSELNIKIYHQDIIKEPLQKIFDGLISSMTLHHIEDLKAFFTTIYKIIKPNGFIAIADLMIEDGTFHSDNSGVLHFGFDEDKLCKIVEECGFKECTFKHIDSIKKPKKIFEVFLLSAQK